MPIYFASQAGMDEANDKNNEDGRVYKNYVCLTGTAALVSKS